MNVASILASLIAAVVVLLAGMAALIKSMLLSRLDEIQKTVSGLSQDMHRLDVRITRLEAEHRINCCSKTQPMEVK